MFPYELIDIINKQAADMGVDFSAFLFSVDKVYKGVNGTMYDETVIVGGQQMTWTSEQFTYNGRAYLNLLDWRMQ